MKKQLIEKMKELVNEYKLYVDISSSGTVQRLESEISALEQQIADSKESGLLTDDCDINQNRLITFVGGNGDYYIAVIDSDDKSHAVRVSTSGGIAPYEVKKAVADLYRAMEKAGLNNGLIADIKEIPAGAEPDEYINCWPIQHIKPEGSDIEYEYIFKEYAVRAMIKYASIKVKEALQSTPKIEAEGKGLPSDEEINQLLINLSECIGDSDTNAVVREWVSSLQLQSLPKEPTPLRDELFAFYEWMSSGEPDHFTLEGDVDDYLNSKEK